LFPLANPDVDSVDHKFPANCDLCNEATMNNLINGFLTLYQILLYDKNIAFILAKQWRQKTSIS